MIMLKVIVLDTISCSVLAKVNTMLNHQHSNASSQYCNPKIWHFDAKTFDLLKVFLN